MQNVKLWCSVLSTTFPIATASETKSLFHGNTGRECISRWKQFELLTTSTRTSTRTEKIQLTVAFTATEPTASAQDVSRTPSPVSVAEAAIAATEPTAAADAPLVGPTRML